MAQRTVKPHGLLTRSLNVLHADIASGVATESGMCVCFDAALKTGDAVLCRLDVAKAVEESLDDPMANGDAKGTTDDDKGAIYQQLLQIARHAFPSPSYCSASNDGAMKLVLFAGKDFDQDTALVRIQKHFKGALGDAADDVLLLDALKGTSTKQIMSFISGQDGQDR